MQFVYCLILFLISLRALEGAPMDVYLNSGTVTNDQVDAVTFINEGTFLINTSGNFGTDIPWDTQNTQNFENRGIMSGVTGFRFDTFNSSNGRRTPAQNFYNDGNAIISVSDTISSFSFDGGTFFAGATPFLSINAFNITNRGILSMDASGLTKIEGGNVDVGGSRIIIRPSGVSDGLSGVTFSRGLFFTETNFFPDPGIYDSGVALGSRTNFFPEDLVLTFGTNTFVSTPGNFNLTNDFICPAGFNLTSPQTYVLTNSTSPTNLVVQVIAVQTPGTNITADAGWLNRIFPANGPNPGFLSSVVVLSAPTTDLLTGTIFTNNLYVIDQLASSTNRNFLVNLGEGTLRPAPIIVTRYSPLLNNFFSNPFTNVFQTNLFSSRSNAVLTPGLLGGPTYSNAFVTNDFAGYAAVIESSGGRLPSLPDVDDSFSFGRVEIGAQNLNMENARIRGEGLVKIVATNLVNSAGALIDSAKVHFDIGSTSNVFNFDNFTRETVERFGGSVIVYSTMWTNIVANPDTNAPIVEVTFHVTLVDATALHTLETMEAYKLRLSAGNGSGTVRINDDAVVTSGFSINARGLEVNNQLSFMNGMTWTSANFPNLQNITNNGTMQLNGVAQFSRPNSQLLSSFVNRGTITSLSFDIRADYFENTGDLISTNFFRQKFTNCLGIVNIFTNTETSIGPISIIANAARLYNGSFTSFGDVKLGGGTYKLDNFEIVAGGRLLLDAGTVFTDTGAGANNVILTQNGIQMTGVRPTGDLFGTLVAVFGRGSSVIDNTWGARDLGPSPVGFQNNLAIGTLALVGLENDRFNFSGTQQGSALYVDVLRLEGSLSSNLTAVAESLRLSNLNIYYGTVESSNPELNAESLDNLQAGNGRLRWVRTFAGPNSSVDVQLPSGEVISVNVALRNSLTIDSDGDGIPNALDPIPFVGPIGVLTNDNFAQATVLTAPTGTIQSNTEVASRETGEPNHAGQSGGGSVWFTFTPSANGLLLLSTAGSSYDTLLALYTGTSLESLVEVASNDDVAGLNGQSEILQTVRAGQKYYIAVDGFEGASGFLNFYYNFTVTQNFPLTTSVIGSGRVSPASGEFPLNSAVSLTAIPDEYNEFLQWETPGGVVISRDNPLTITVNGPVNVVARFVPQIFTENFETGGFANPGFVSTSGWSVIQTRTPRGFVAGSVQPPDRSTNSLVLVTQSSAGQASFEYLVNTEPEFDRLEFYVNGILRQAWSGAIDWSTYSFAVPSGNVRLEWRYVKDSAFAPLEDRVLINNIKLPSPGSVVSGTVLNSGSRQISIKAGANKKVLVEVSSDFKKWTVLGTVATDASGNATFTDVQGKDAQRFYRVNAP